MRKDPGDQLANSFRSASPPVLLIVRRLNAVLLTHECLDFYTAYISSTNFIQSLYDALAENMDRSNLLGWIYIK